MDAVTKIANDGLDVNIVVPASTVVGLAFALSAPIIVFFTVKCLLYE